MVRCTSCNTLTLTVNRSGHCTNCARRLSSRYTSRGYDSSNDNTILRHNSSDYGQSDSGCNDSGSSDSGSSDSGGSSCGE